MSVFLTRRAALQGLAGFGALLALGACSNAGDNSDVATIEWQDLIPEGGGVSMDRLREGGVVEHGEYSSAFVQEAAAAGVTTQYNDKRVRLPGFIVPVAYSGVGVTAFLLVPYVGACIHVPPPPPNQIVFVTAPSPYESGGMFEPIQVIGKLQTAAVSTELAEVGYTMDAEIVEPYRG